jgi:hypothetical protein
MKKTIRIFQVYLNFEEEDNTSYLILVETIEFKPVRCYFYKVPKNISSQELTRLEERYYPISRN